MWFTCYISRIGLDRGNHNHALTRILQRFTMGEICTSIPLFDNNTCSFVLCLKWLHNFILHINFDKHWLVKNYFTP